MKAAVIREVGDASVFKIEEVADPVAQPGEVVVDLRAASVNRRDRGIRAGVLVPRGSAARASSRRAFRWCSAPTGRGRLRAGSGCELGRGG